jgi:hypothetical protein
MYVLVMKEREDPWNSLFGLLDPAEKDITHLRNFTDLISIRHFEFLWNQTLQEYQYEILTSKNKIRIFYVLTYLLIAHSNAQDSKPDGIIQFFNFIFFKYF